MSEIRELFTWIVAVLLLAFIMFVCSPSTDPMEEPTKPTDVEAVANATRALQVKFTSTSDTTNSVTSDVTLVTNDASNGVAISWASSATPVITTAGAVTQPGEDTKVILRATLYKGPVTNVKEFILTVIGTNISSNNVINDTDKDGIPDINEIPGSTFFGLPLYDWGARTNIRDIFVHINYMESDNRGIIPQKAALDKVVKAFSNKSINVHFDVGDLFDRASGVDPSNYDLSDTNHVVPYISNIPFSLVYNYKDTYMPTNKRQIFYYALFADLLLGNYPFIPSGIATLRGTHLIITLGSRFTTDTSSNFVINRQSGVLMHELGHNLGLHHGGHESQNYKPNYFSVMNYLYGTRRGLPSTFGQASERYYFQLKYHKTNETALSTLSNGPYTASFKIDFSDGTSLDLNENNLNEYTGIGRNLGAIDWNTNGSTNSNVSFNINPDDGENKSVLSDHDDWGNLYFIFYHRANRNQLNVAGAGTLDSKIFSQEKSALPPGENAIICK